MLIANNASLTDGSTFWTRDTMLRAMGLSHTPADHKKFERMVRKDHYLPTVTSLAELKSALAGDFNASIVNQEIEGIKSKRGKFFVCQIWRQNKEQPLICATDGRGKQYWRFIEDDTKLPHQISFFITELHSHVKKPILVIPHGEATAIFDKVKFPAPISVRNAMFSEPLEQPFKKAFVDYVPQDKLTHLDKLEAESIHIIREVMAEAQNPVMLYSLGKDSAVMLHLARKAFWPASPPFPLLHVDTNWKFRSMYEYRDHIAKSYDMNLIIHKNLDGIEQGISPLEHGAAIHTDIMKTVALKQALDLHKFDVAFGGARRDEEKSRSKERIFSFRTDTHQWDPKKQRPELWSLFNAKIKSDESIRVFPLSNWTELDIWNYIYREKIPLVPLYFAKSRPTIIRNGQLFMVDDDRMVITKSDDYKMRNIRFRTLGCYPLTAAITSEADTLEKVILELISSKSSEREGRVIDNDATASMEQKKKEGYF